VTFFAFNRTALFIGRGDFLVAFRTLIHDFLLFQLNLSIQLLDGPGGLREKVMATVAVAESLLMTVMGERNVPETAAKQNHFLCAVLNLDSADRNDRYQDNKQYEENHFYYGWLHKFKLGRAGVFLAGLTFQCTLAKVYFFPAFAADMLTVEFIRKYFFFCATLRTPALKGLEIFELLKSWTMLRG